MSKFIPMETPQGTVIFEIDDSEENIALKMVGGMPKIPKFDEAVKSARDNLQFILDNLRDMEPDNLEISCGLKAGLEGGNSFWGIAKASGEASFTIKLKWEKK